MCLLSLLFSLFIPVSASLWSCVSLSLTISLPSLDFFPLPPSPQWDSVSMKEARFWEPDPWVTWGKERSFISRSYSQAQDPQHLPFQPSLQCPWPKKGEVKGSKP